MEFARNPAETTTFFDEKRTIKQGPSNNTITYRYLSEYSQSKRKLKIEINCREHFNVLGLKRQIFSVENDWLSKSAAVNTYEVEELLGSKLRALYQRKKGRDLFDLYYAFEKIPLNIGKIIKCYQKYMSFSVKSPPSQKQFLANIIEKNSDSIFTNDMDNLLRPEISYDIEKAFSWIKSELIPKI